MRNSKARLLALLGVVFLAGCSDTTGPQADDDIRGRVVDAQGDPVTDARIVLQYEYPGAARADKPGTQIIYELPESGPVTFWISSYCDGDTVRMLVDGESPGGSIAWNGRDDDQRIVPDGVYRYHLITESGEQTAASPLFHLGYGDLMDEPLAPHAVVDDQGRFTLDQACLGFGFTYDIMGDDGEPSGTATISRRVRVWAISEAADTWIASREVTVDPDTGFDIELTLGR